jgi:uncharacterized membrane protein YbhN (UPF0104 family)
MKNRVAIINCLVSCVIMVVLAYYVSPEKLFEVVRHTDPVSIVPVLAMTPLFLAFRVSKWLVLLLPNVPNLDLRQHVAAYLGGMVLGLITPARVGEVFRIWAAGLSMRFSGYFIVEKGLELCSLYLLSLLALWTAILIPWWVVILGTIPILLLLIHGPSIIRVPALLLNRISQPLFASFASEFRLPRWSIGLSFLFSATCSLIFCLQVYLTLHAMGAEPQMKALVYFPLILVGSWVPLTFGGFGGREALAVLFLERFGLSGSDVFGAFFFVGVIDLIVPCLFGIWWLGPTLRRAYRLTSLKGKRHQINDLWMSVRNLVSLPERAETAREKAPSLRWRIPFSF